MSSIIALSGAGSQALAPLSAVNMLASVFKIPFTVSTGGVVLACREGDVHGAFAALRLLAPCDRRLALYGTSVFEAAQVQFGISYCTQPAWQAFG